MITFEKRNDFTAVLEDGQPIGSVTRSSKGWNGHYREQVLVRNAKTRALCGAKLARAVKRSTYDVVGGIMAFEQGELDVEHAIELFQYLNDTGLINGLQGSYQRTMARLIDQGLVERYTR